MLIIEKAENFKLNDLTCKLLIIHGINLNLYNCFILEIDIMYEIEKGGIDYETELFFTNHLLF